MHLFTGHTPHVYIARDDTDECKDMQSWLNMVLSDDVGSQWVLVEDKVRFNPILEVYEISWWHVWSVFKTAWMRESVEECMLVSDSIAADLERIPDILWSKGPTDVGRLNVPPYRITTATNTKPQLRQYPISREAREGAIDCLRGYREAGVIIPFDKEGANTPIYPIRKKGSKVRWRFIYDLRAINALTKPSVCI